MMDGTPMSVPTASIPEPSSTLVPRPDGQPRPHAHQSVLHHASQQDALLSNQHATATNANINLAAFPTLDTTRRVLDHFNSTSPPLSSLSPLGRGETFGTSATSATSGLEFRSRTIAPSPSDSPSPPRNALSPSTGDESPSYQRSPLSGERRSGSATRPHIDPSAAATARSRRDSAGNTTSSLSPTTPVRTSTFGLQHKTSTSSLQPPSRTPSFKTSLGPGFGTASAASSTYPSPIIAAMGDLTPLPSPLLVGDSPGPWRRFGRPPSRETAVPTPGADSVLISSNGESIAAALANNTKRKAYAGLAVEVDGSAGSGGAPGGGARSETKAPATAGTHQVHTRNRSVSDYTPDPMLLPKRMLTVTGSRGSAKPPAEDALHLRREPHLSAARGLTPVEKPPTPPPSESSLSAGESSSSSSTTSATGGQSSSTPQASHRYEYFEARNRRDGKMRRWRAVKMLGQGTFSRVMLATSAPPEIEEDDESGAGDSDQLQSLRPPPHQRYDRRTLVAVKVCEHGPKGGASEDRVEMSLKRELEIMQSIRHPSLVHLRAWNIEPTRAILILSYCPGGDLFDVATAHRKLLSPSLMRRIFSELVGAVRYLHERRIVHRDIKLENVLVNLTPSELADPSIDWTTYPYPVSTLTDLGLSRRVADDEKLETRCGSDDYAAPEVIMGQPYDGRAIDAWSLGVLLYALLESRLPFDPLPGTVNGADSAHRMRSRTSHRIARVEWRWVAFAGEDGDHDGDEAMFRSKDLLGAMNITEGLLKRARSRWTVEKVAASEWVRDAIQVKGGIRFRDEDEGGDVSL
ncbi:CAMK protein kinase [Gaeumannomyces tritici R3-111a-1]|uniref:CAMK protein kinase n=1 Tax=Gaeumannomyces tritici (strain R3-111a-1) TaxID=644352 RepID=J3PBI9_GAET3|nr:CAMK protein kinase [Gaeumannomyces tritici R3-111a-1]EJT71606.1 CAMK protein kinase [Gaeumannomyces tritici R3-111a-1]